MPKSMMIRRGAVIPWGIWESSQECFPLLGKWCTAKQKGANGDVLPSGKRATRRWKVSGAAATTNDRQQQRLGSDERDI